MSKTRASVSKVLGTKQPWSWVGGPVSNHLTPSGEGKIDGCHWGINMIFFLFFFSLLDSGRPSFTPLLLHHYTTSPSPELIEMGIEGHGIKFWGLFSG